MYIFDLGIKNKKITSAVITYYILSFILSIIFSESDYIKFIVVYLILILVPHSISGFVRTIRNCKNIKFIWINLVLPVIACMLLIGLNINLSNTDYSKEAYLRAYSDLDINDEEYASVVNNYNKLENSYKDKRLEFDSTKAKNGDLDELNKNLDEKIVSYKEQYPSSLKDEYENLVKESEKYALEVDNLNNKITYNQTIRNNKNNNYTSQNNNPQSNTAQSISSGNSSSTVTKEASSNNSSSSTSSKKTLVYIASGNNYYHKTSNCKFIKGLSVQSTCLEDCTGKYKCNCWNY